MQSNITDTRRRVKVYQLNEDRQWDDRGTGHVQTHVDQTDGAVSLLVKSETDQQILLDSEIRQDTNYSKQQETLIVWSEDNSDLALSFQERSGCEEIWEKICNQQGRDPDANDTIQSSDDEEDIDLPPPEMSKLNQIKECFTNQNRVMHSNREKLSSALKNQGYSKTFRNISTK
jgi:protein phosphatase-4 regulatory subunit 3